ncbi:2Fe-2S iron-sulfur cluster binding domain-containing protein [Romeria aff. gracilis LEGE 07310]|uniref:2Fe-2S iron-sulfur cluster binding domain-containing protein n=1 Tax=Vasconcelosia minhoensis LEGE 07310 TaxID=915328 RepID=A0A8J7AHV9_9CYAN|nr:2Fe-2S iron-sulfur cluster-binding protein [Romeria gracilis]MBE9077848.1 2Fe-2S iron-sulfur cluster binding domain-containing protein [Romeria aff. gracilis LEGE 07310]
MSTEESTVTYQVTLINEARNFNATINVRSDEYITEAAEQQGIQLPVSCRAGACISCSGQLVEGSVGQGHCFLTPKEEAAGFVLTCKAYPRSNCTILTDREDALLEFSDRL